jgi:hypothetical protein
MVIFIISFSKNFSLFFFFEQEINDAVCMTSAEVVFIAQEIAK